MKQKLSIMKQYLQLLAKADYEALMELFSAEAVVYSPVYGEKLASDFYRELFEDTTASILRFQEGFVNEASNSSSLYFTYTWKMANGETYTFDCVDIFQFDESQKITSLRIIYDSAGAKEALSK
ncbi:MAG: nuclear transport factor 2 family protein [Saprospiraceae bacterium]|nr:nuclear transport factor 2 family protein [Saprospiraceae bacterium]